MPNTYFATAGASSIWTGFILPLRTSASLMPLMEPLNIAPPEPSAPSSPRAYAFFDGSRIVSRARVGEISTQPFIRGPE